MSSFKRSYWLSARGFLASDFVNSGKASYQPGKGAVVVYLYSIPAKPNAPLLEPLRASVPAMADPSAQFTCPRTRQELCGRGKADNDEVTIIIAHQR
jgi:hypothetical protein